MKEVPDVVVDIEAEATEGAKSHVPTKNVSNLNKADAQGGIESLKSSVTTTTKQIIFEEKNNVLKTSLGDAANHDFIITNEKHEGPDAVPYSSLMDAPNPNKIISEEKIEVAGHDGNDSKVNNDMAVIEIDEAEEETSCKGPDDVHVIDLDVDQASPEKIWNYLDPSGNVQGPFSLITLQYWMEEGFFDEDFRIWKASQSQEDAIPLGVALSSLQLP